MRITRISLASAALVVAGMLLWEAAVTPRIVAGAPSPRWSPAEASEHHVRQCREDLPAAWAGTFTTGPALAGHSGFLLVFRSGDAVGICSSGVDGHGRGGGRIEGVRPGDRPLSHIAGYGDVQYGYVGPQVAEVRFITASGKVFPAPVRSGMYVVDLPGAVGEEMPGLVLRALDRQGRVVDEFVFPV